MRQIIIDTETTGLAVAKGHRIIEFAALEVIDRELSGRSLHLYINPERQIEEEASKIHGITNDSLRDKLVFLAHIPQILEFIKDAQLIIHNAKFDLGFLDYQLLLHGYNKVESYVDGVIDTLTLARKKFPGSKNNLNALCDRFVVDRSKRGFHGALVDCQLLYDVYLQLSREDVITSKPSKPSKPIIITQSTQKVNNKNSLMIRVVRKKWHY